MGVSHQQQFKRHHLIITLFIVAPRFGKLRTKQARSEIFRHCWGVALVLQAQEPLNACECEVAGVGGCACVRAYQYSVSYDIDIIESVRPAAVRGCTVSQATSTLPPHGAQYVPVSITT